MARTQQIKEDKCTIYHTEVLFPFCTKRDLFSVLVKVRTWNWQWYSSLPNKGENVPLYISHVWSLPLEILVNQRIKETVNNGHVPIFEKMHEHSWDVERNPTLDQPWNTGEPLQIAERQFFQSPGTQRVRKCIFWGHAKCALIWASTSGLEMMSWNKRSLRRTSNRVGEREKGRAKTWLNVTKFSHPQTRTLNIDSFVGLSPCALSLKHIFFPQRVRHQTIGAFDCLTDYIFTLYFLRSAWFVKWHQNQAKAEQIRTVFFCCSFFRLEDKQLFSIEEIRDGTHKVAFKANNGRYVTARPNGSLYATVDPTAFGPSEAFIVTIVNRPLLVLRCDFGFVGFKTAANPRIECNKSTCTDMTYVEHSDDNASYYLKGKIKDSFILNFDRFLSILLFNVGMKIKNQTTQWKTENSCCESVHEKTNSYPCVSWPKRWADFLEWRMKISLNILWNKTFGSDSSHAIHDTSRLDQRQWSADKLYFCVFDAP